MSTQTRTESSWRTPELLLSFAGHVLVVGIAVLVTMGHVARDTRKPIVFNVAVVSPGTPLPATETKGTTLVESKPKSQAKTETETKAEPKKGSDVVKRQGLGARIEGAEALGYSYYLNVILSRISDNWLNPYAGGTKILTATVMFVIERDGMVKDVKVEKKSGDAAYDASCERALLVLDRLPPLPPEFTGPRLKLHLEFEQKP
ncbi:MAG: energy transducer TonB [candidate division WOR-3 bacterium]|nr:energy transducer TonB [candidate division WOR-3 bacterium]